MRFGSRTVIAAVVTAAVALVAVPAHAADRDGTLDPGELTFYFVSKAYTGSTICTGSRSDFATAKKKLDGYKFLSSGAGSGQYVKNNATCAYNYRATDARVYFNSFCEGPSDPAVAYHYSDLSNTWNDNASFVWLNGYDCTP